MQKYRPIHNLVVAALACIGGTVSIPAAAQQADRVQEMYHIFDIKTDARKAVMTKSLTDGLNPNISDSQTITPLVMGPPPAAPARFTLVDPLQDSRFGAFASMMGAVQAAQFKQVKCDGAIWISTAQRNIGGSQHLRLTLCLFPYAGGYNLDVYALDTKEKGGGIAAKLGRAIAGGVVGKPEEWTNKTIVDVLRRIRRDTGAVVTYVEGQPELVGEPWNDDRQIMPSDKEKPKE